MSRLIVRTFTTGTMPASNAPPYIGCELSDFSDIFWNEERISSLMRKVDAVTVAAGLVHLPAMAAGQLKN